VHARSWLRDTDRQPLELLPHALRRTGPAGPALLQRTGEHVSLTLSSSVVTLVIL